MPVLEKSRKDVEELEPIKEKVIVIPTSLGKESLEMNSPLYKIKNIIDKYKDVSNMTESKINRIIKGEKQPPP